MEKATIFSVFSLFLLVPASIIWAQTISSEKGLTTVLFHQAKGTITIYLPDDIRPGDMISGSFKAEPAAGNAKQQQKALNELLKSKLKIGDPSNPGQVAEALAQRYQADIGGGFIRIKQAGLPFTISLTDATNKTLSVPINSKPLIVNPGNAAPKCVLPPHVLAGAPLRITGPFDGDIGNTSCRLNNEPVPVLAESPRACIVNISATLTGEQTMQVKETGGNTCERKIAMVELKVSAPKTNLLKGEKTVLTVQVNGLQGLQDTAILKLENKTTGIVDLKPSNNIIIGLFPDSFYKGKFIREFAVQSISTGTFSININLDLPDEENTNQYGIFCNDKCSPVGAETDAAAGEVGISSSAGSSPDAEDKAIKTAKWVVNNGDLLGATGNEDAALDALEKIARTRGYVVWVKLCWMRCEKGFFCNDWEKYCGDWIPVLWVDGLENDGGNTFRATGGHSTTGKDKVEGLTRKEILELAVKIGNSLAKKK